MEGDGVRLSRMAGRVATTAEEMPQEICRDEEIALPLHHQNKWEIIKYKWQIKTQVPEGQQDNETEQRQQAAEGWRERSGESKRWYALQILTQVSLRF